MLRVATRRTLPSFGAASARCMAHVPIDDRLFGLDDETQQLRHMSRTFFEAELGPHARQIDADDAFPGFRDFMIKCGEMGFHGMTVPVEYGGTDMGYLKATIMAEEGGRVAAGVTMSMGAHQNLCINQLVRNASTEQKEKWLPDLLEGTKIGGLAMSETEAGSDVMSMKTVAVKKGDHYIINGSKVILCH